MILLLTFILVVIHTLTSIYFLCFTCNTKQDEILAGAEDGCCGAAAIMISFISHDSNAPPKKDGSSFKIRRTIRAMTIIFQFPLLVAIGAYLQLSTAADAWETEKTNVYVLFPCLMLNLVSIIENIGEITTGYW